MKKRYYVGIREVYVSTRVVDAESKDEAISRVRDGQVEEELDLEYSHTLDEKFWTVEESDELSDEAQGELDEMVYDLKCKEASDINNGGREGQLVYLCKKGQDYLDIFNWTTEQLDDAVISIKEYEASVINNQGPDSQRKYINGDCNDEGDE